MVRTVMMCANVHVIMSRLAVYMYTYMFYVLFCTHSFQFYLTVLGDNVSDLVKSAAVPFVRPVSQSMQLYDSDKSQYPITQPMSKLSSLLQVSAVSWISNVCVCVWCCSCLSLYFYQASGEAQYTTDIPIMPGELTAAFVLTSVVCTHTHTHTHTPCSYLSLLMYISM